MNEVRRLYEIDVYRSGAMIGVATVEALDTFDALGCVRRDALRDGLGRCNGRDARLLDEISYVMGAPDKARMTGFRRPTPWEIIGSGKTVAPAVESVPFTLDDYDLGDES